MRMTEEFSWSSISELANFEFVCLECVLSSMKAQTTALTIKRRPPSTWGFDSLAEQQLKRASLHWQEVLHIQSEAETDNTNPSKYA